MALRRADGEQAAIGMIGLGTMGGNLALNMADHGFRVAVYDLSFDRTRAFIADHPDAPGGLIGHKTLRGLVRGLARPRRIVILVPAGKPVDDVCDLLRPYLDKGDVLVDGGNSLFTDTIARERAHAARGVHFVGCGVSGGEVGARFGPSLMPGGSEAAWKALRPIWRAIAAKVDRKTGRELVGAQPGKPLKGGVPCTAHMGTDGAGHHVKMVHNGIEYGDMQLICEAYFVLKNVLGAKPAELAEIFGRWNAGPLDSFLIEITADILQQRDPANRRVFLVDRVLDTAGQKGTGKWTSSNALDLGVPAPTVTEAVHARFLSAIKDQRVAASKSLRGPRFRYRGGKARLIDAVRDALYCSKIASYAQGFALMVAAQQEYGWSLNFGDIARIWRGGCIIRARFLQKIAEAYGRDRRLKNLMLDRYFRGVLHRGQKNWRNVVALCAESGVPAPAFASALAYYDGYRTGRLPANLLQAQRDYFGAHSFERTDEPRGRFFHVDWPEEGRPMTRVR